MSQAQRSAIHAPVGPVKFSNSTGFHRDLKASIHARLEELGLQTHGGWRLAGKSVVIVGWAVLSYWALMLNADTWWLALALAVSLGLAVSAIGFNIMHDAGHGAFARNRHLNRAAFFTLDLIGGSSYVWSWKHNRMHHIYSNIAGHDDDIDAEPFLRLAPSQQRRYMHRFQHWYVWPLYCFLAAKWWFFDDFACLVRGHIGGRPVSRPRGIEAVLFVVGKIAFVGWFLVLPLAVHSVAQVAIGVIVMSSVVGVTISVVFQLAHAVQEADFTSASDARRMDRSWAEHQVATTVDFSRHKRIVTWFVGGLNMQVEHHLFPQISHVRYVHIAPVVERVCNDHKVPYNVHQSLASGIASHVRWLRQMGAAGSPG